MKHQMKSRRIFFMCVCWPQQYMQISIYCHVGETFPFWCAWFHISIWSHSDRTYSNFRGTRNEAKTCTVRRCKEKIFQTMQKQSCKFLQYWRGVTYSVTACRAVLVFSLKNVQLEFFLYFMKNSFSDMDISRGKYIRVFSVFYYNNKCC